MASNTLQTYLQDHLAGSAGGISLIHRLEKGSDSEAEGRELREIVAEIEADRDTLVDLMGRVGAKRSRIKNLVATVGDNLSWPKLRSSSSDGRLLKLEAMIIGVNGKRGLWSSLLALIETGDTTFEREEIVRLRDRADDQIARLGELHQATAARVLCA